MLDLAMELSHATNFNYKYGEVYKISDYTADGTIFDYMAGVRKVCTAKWVLYIRHK